MNEESKPSFLDFIPTSEATSKLGMTERELIKSALSGDTNLYHLVKKPGIVVFALAQVEPTFENEYEWLSIFNYDDDQKEICESIAMNIGDALKLDSRCLRSLLLNEGYSELDLLRGQFDAENTIKNYPNTNYWGGELDWISKSELDQMFNMSYTYLDSTQIVKDGASPPIQDLAATSTQSNTSLKVIGLLMHHLAKSPKYASGTKPNKSQIKELLIDLADELNVDPYGLNKVDERVLADAMKYLENQKR